MQVYTSLDEIPKSRFSLTIGSFDTLHKGHVQLIELLTETPHVLITFTNHPLEILQPRERIQTLCTLQTKLEQLNQLGVEHAVTLPFSLQIQQMSYQNFLTRLHKRGMQKLILGKGAVLGAGRQGNEQAVNTLANSLDFETQYLPPIMHKNSPISSTRVREEFQAGNLEEVKELLGRNYTLIWDPEINWNCLVHPPKGEYLCAIDHRQLPLKWGSKGLEAQFDKPTRIELISRL